MTIERNENEIVLRVPSNIGTFGLESIVRYVKYLESVKDSVASENDVDELAAESKKRWWSENKVKYIK